MISFLFVLSVLFFIFKYFTTARPKILYMYFLLRSKTIIRPPDRKWDWGVNDIMPRSDGLKFLVILKKKQLVQI